MPGLLSLSNELLVQIFTASPDIEMAMRLSSVNKQLRAVWLQHSDQIIEGVIKSTIPAADEAIAFAITETQLRTPLNGHNQPPLRLWLPNLMRNADLCHSAHTACATYADPPNSIRKTPKKFPSSPASYYFLRRVLLAFEYPQLRNAIEKELRTTPEITREEYFQFTWFLMQFATEEEVVRQGVPLHVRFPEPPSPGDDENDMHKDPWSYLGDVVSSARVDFTDLPMAIQGYVT